MDSPYAPQNLFEARNLVKRIGTVVIADGVDIQVPMGSIVGMIGPNGAGKTTMLGIFSGSVKANSGTVEFKGHDITTVGPARRARLGIGRTFQIPRPFAKLTVFEHALLAVQQSRRVSLGEAHERAMLAIKQCGLLKLVNEVGGDLRLLDRKRLEMARAVALDPSLVLLDEVAGGLNNAEVGQLIEIVLSLRDGGISFLWVEHVIRALNATADRIVCLSGGHLIAEGSPAEVLEHPAVIESYFGSPAFMSTAS
jgi:branched-chain amino acid transport system ATP-binding protein